MGIFSNLFNKPLEPIDFGIIKTDVHSHLIPGIDDGSRSMEDTLNMLHKFQDLGYKKVITTPHIMSDYFNNNREIIYGGLEKVREAIQKVGLQIEIEAAAEYYTDTMFQDLIGKKDLLTFGKNYVLFELSFQYEPANVKEVIFELTSAGYQPILAHVERYPYYVNKWDKIEDYINRGVLLQLNLNSLTGGYGKDIQKMAQSLIERDLIDLVGSDCHRFEHLMAMESLKTNKYVHQILNKPGLLNKTL
ncbi:MAG: CpsB/CapC family capsule biosynthesis tyrosine phosphatase [Crocinitomicaceae bacterium]|nr:histidinol phosphatase [Crocinitomicaceae bacterium]